MATNSRVANRADATRNSTEREGQIQTGERQDAADGFESDCRFGIASKTREIGIGSRLAYANASTSKNKERCANIKDGR